MNTNLNFKYTLIRKEFVKASLYIVFLLLLIPVLILGNRHKCPVLRQKELASSMYALAKPANARKYNVDCTYCHTTWPQLNRQGYMFRLLGYRMPWEVYNGTYRAKAKATGSVKNPLTASNNLPQSIASNLNKTVNKVVIPENTPANISKGGEIFVQQQCNTCHVNGGNAIDPSKPLKGPSFLKDCPTNEVIENIVRKGVPGTAMPAYEEERLSDSDLQYLILYVRSLTPKP